MTTRALAPKEPLSLLQTIRDRRGVGWCLQTIAMLEAAAGCAQRGAWLYGGEAMLQSVGAVGQSVVTQVQERYLAPARQALGEAAFQDATRDGRATSVARIMEMDPGAFASA